MNVSRLRNCLRICVSPRSSSARRISVHMYIGLAMLAMALFPALARGQAPVVSGLSPSSGSISGGTVVTIAGTGFTGATAVGFGSTSAFSFTVNSDTQITATTPKSTTADTVLVTVTTPGGSSNSTESFTYLPFESCAGAGNTSHTLPAGYTGTDLTMVTDLYISGGITCTVDGSVPGGNYVYRNVNIWGGTLTFADAKINFHAHSILIEDQGTFQAGSDQNPLTKSLSIWLYGSKDDGIASITCQSGPTCGVPQGIWDSNPNVVMKMRPGAMVPC